MVIVLSTKEFDTWEKILSRDYGEIIGRVIDELKTTWNLGKPLGYPYFREKKFDKYRIYFLVYEDINTVLLVSISDKKAQQETINKIKEDIDIYHNLIKHNITKNKDN